jgi:exosortase/archaeosortase family protein
MTTITKEASLPRPRVFAALRGALSRDEFFAGLFILGCINGLFGRVLLAWTSEGWSGLLGIDISIIVLFACFAGWSTLLESRREPTTPADLAVGGIFLVLVALPIFSLSWIAVTGLSIYILIFASESSERIRGAIIMLALTVPMLWSKLLFQFFNRLILEIDASLAALVLNVPQVGTVVPFRDGSGFMVVLPACSSLANMSLAFLCWVSVTQWAKHRWVPTDLLWSLLAVISVVGVNVTRIALSGISRDYYDAIHGSWWANTVVGSTILALTILFSVISARRELFARN